MHKLTGKQQAFVEEYCRNGQNASQAYKIAYPDCKANYDVHGAENMVKRSIKQAIDKELALIKAESIATRQMRQQFWTETMQFAPQMGDRLRASELLGKSEADFTDNIKQTGSGLNLNFTTTESEAVQKATDGPRIAKVGKEAG